MNHNLITYKILCNIHLQPEKNIITMAKSIPKSLDNQSNQRARIHHHVKVKRPKKPP